MSPPIAQTLFLTMTRGMSLREWERTGLLEREWAIYARIARSYHRIVVVSHGDDSDLEVAARLRPRPTVLTNRDRLTTTEFVASLPQRIPATLGPIESAVIKTNQMDDGGSACMIADRLRRSSTPCALIARCGYLRSQFLAAEFGAGSGQAIDAALIERTVIGMADLTVGTTGQIVSDLAWRDALDADRVRVIPNYVLDEARPDGRAHREPGRLLCVGQLVPRKRIDLLIRAIAELRDEHDVTLEVIGDGPEEPSLRALAAGLDAPVEFTPRMPHRRVLDRLRQASVYLQTSSLEGHPKTLMEAMACGAPCIVADAPGLASLIHTGVTGVCVAADPKALAYAIAGLLEDGAWREQLGACAARFARSNFGLDHVADLELEAHRAALRLATSQGLPTPCMVRWNPALLNRTPDQIAAEWCRAFDTLLARLPASQQARVRSARDARDQAA